MSSSSETASVVQVSADSSKQDATSKKKLRSIEKSRTATCQFADLVADCVVKHYRGLQIKNAEADEALRGQAAQTCVSAIVMLFGDELTVCSLGIGTKIVPEEVAACDTFGERVLDSHAEVLARRGFIRYLYAQIRATREHSEAHSIFTLTEFGKYHLKDGITFHLYCSSAPCGNACVRRWAKGQSEHYRDELTRFEWPAPLHSKLHLHNVLQVAVLCKVQPKGPSGQNECNALGNPKDEEHSEISARVQRMEDEMEIPPGTALPDSPFASSRATCSDKVAKWCALGLQGTLAQSFLASEGIRPSTIIVGRKFARPHLERAVCCRVASFLNKSEPHSVSVLCTSVKLHEGGFDAESKALFTDFALVWCLEWDQQKPAEILKPTVGLPLTDNGMLSAVPSMVARSSLFALYQLERGCSMCEFDHLTYAKVKSEVVNPEQRQRAERIFAKCLKGWPKYRFRKDSTKEQLAIPSSDSST